MESRTKCALVAALVSAAIIGVGCRSGGVASRSLAGTPTASAAASAVVTAYAASENTTADVDAARAAIDRTLMYAMPSLKLSRSTMQSAEMIPSSWWDSSKVKPHKVVAFVAPSTKGLPGPPWRFTVVQTDPGSVWFVYQIARGY